MGAFRPPRCIQHAASSQIIPHPQRGIFLSRNHSQFFALTEISAQIPVREYYPLLERLKLPKSTLHTTRHTFASKMVEAGARPEDLQKIMGHADYSVTANIYNYANAKQLTKAIRLLG